MVREFPLFWMNETTGEMKNIVLKFFEDIKLSPEELEILKKYIIQWIEGTIFQTRHFFNSEEKYQEYLRKAVPPDYKDVIRKSDQTDLSEYVSNTLLEYGIDPF